MIIDCISDLHGYYPELEGGDLLIVAGDLTAKDTVGEHFDFHEWLNIQPYKKKVLIAGNHDNILQMLGKPNSNAQCEYLCDSGTTYRDWPYLEDPTKENEGKVIEVRDFKIWGSPWTASFKGMNPHCKAFTCDTEEQLAEKWALIPDDIDILITHSPMKHMLDQNIDGYACGIYSLRDAIDRIKPKLFIFGHIHEQGGQMLLYKHEGLNTICVNASHVNERYKPVNKPVRIEI